MRRAGIAKNTDFAVTIDYVADYLGLSTSMASRIEQDALRKCRKICRRWGLTFEELALHLRSENPFVGHDDYEAMR